MRQLYHTTLPASPLQLPLWVYCCGIRIWVNWLGYMLPIVLDAVQRESSPVFPASGSIPPGSWTIACDTGLMLQRVFLRGEQGTGSVHGLTLSWTAASPQFTKSFALVWERLLRQGAGETPTLLLKGSWYYKRVGNFNQRAHCHLTTAGCHNCDSLG